MPTSQDKIISAILDFGGLLNSHYAGVWRRPNEERIKTIKQREEALTTEIETSGLKSLKPIFGFDSGGKHIDPLALRIICLVAAAQFNSSSAVEVNAAAKTMAVDGDPCQPLHARQTIFRLCVQRVITLEEGYYGKQELKLGRPIMDFLKGSATEPLLISQTAVRQAQQEIAFRKRRSDKQFSSVRTAQQIYQELSKFVIGQHDLKVALAVAGRQTLLRCVMRLQNTNRRLPPKVNALILGASGSGKSYACQCLSKILKLPYASMDVSTATSSGYVGDDVSGILYLLSQSAVSMGVDPQEGGILFFDEADKISASHYESPTTTGVQFELLRILDGGSVSFPVSGMNKWGGAGATMDTSNLFVVCSGAFSWLEPIWQGTKSNIGFASTDRGRSQLTEVREILNTKGGLIPELTNRFSAIVKMDALTPSDIAVILENEQGPLGEYRAALAAEQRTISIEPEAALLIGQWSIDQGLMGRGPKSALERLLRDPLFSGQPKEVVITPHLVKQVLQTA